MQSMADSADREFEFRLAKGLCAEFPEAREMDAARLLSGVREQVAKAASYGLSTEPEAATYLWVAWLFGETFDRDLSAVRELLTATQISGERKAQLLREWAAQTLIALDQ
jgi:hypothetical protein